MLHRNSQIRIQINLNKHQFLEILITEKESKLNGQNVSTLD